jgi:hypothetical protein
VWADRRVTLIAFRVYACLASHVPKGSNRATVESDQIAIELGYDDPHTVRKHLRRLEEWGIIQRPPRTDGGKRGGGWVLVLHPIPGERPGRLSSGRSLADRVAEGDASAIAAITEGSNLDPFAGLKGSDTDPRKGAIRPLRRGLSGPPSTKHT